MAQAVTMSSAGTATMILDPVAARTTIMVSATTGSSGGFLTVEVTLDDPTLVPLGGPSVTWGTLSSAAAMLSSNITTALIYANLTNIGGVRLNSSVFGNIGSVTLKALQSETA